VVVIGEKPYAEGAGDRVDLSLAPEDVTAVKQYEGAGNPSSVILFSGRPLILGDVLDQSDAFLAAWLPGTEGDGIADVLFGAYKPTGKLSFAWPRSMEQYPRAKIPTRCSLRIRADILNRRTLMFPPFFGPIANRLKAGDLVPELNPVNSCTLPMARPGRRPTLRATSPS